MGFLFVGVAALFARKTPAIVHFVFARPQFGQVQVAVVTYKMMHQLVGRVRKEATNVARSTVFVLLLPFFIYNLPFFITLLLCGL